MTINKPKIKNFFLENDKPVCHSLELEFCILLDFHVKVSKMGWGSWVSLAHITWQ